MTDELSIWRVSVPEQAPEIERAAITILSRASIQQPLLAIWVECLLTDPGYAVPLSVATKAFAFEQSPRWQQMLATHGNSQAVIESLRAAGEAVADVFEAIERGSAYPNPRRSKREQTVIRLYDLAVWRLASELARYRYRGRPTGDTESDVRGLGGVLMTVSTSLAAAVAEYAYAIQDIVASLEMGYLDD